MTIAEQLADEVVSLRSATLASEVMQRAGELLLDYLGVTLGGSADPSSAAVRDGLAALGGHGASAVLGQAKRLPATQAAIANGAAAHALEMDDTHQGGSVHPGAPVWSAALAACTLAPANGEAVLRAGIAGYEVTTRLAMALGPAAQYRRGFHPTGTCGTFGAAAAAGLLLGLDAEQLANALGIAGSQAAGSMEFLADGAWTKRLHPGWAAAGGLHAAAVARAGFRAPATIFEGRFGTLHAYSEGGDVGPLQERRGFELLQTSIKPHACCRYCQSPIDAALSLRSEHRLEPDVIERIDVGIVSAGFPIVCEPPEQKSQPRSVVDAQFSLPFCLAVAIAHGSASPDDFALPVLSEPGIVDLMSKVNPQRDPALDVYYPNAWPSWVRIRLRSGESMESRVMHPKGDPECFPTPDEQKQKFRSLAARAIPAAQVERVLAAVQELPTMPRAASLLEAAVAGAR